MTEMSEFALIRDGETVSEFREHEAPPVYEQEAKPWVWLPVSRVTGTPAGTIVDIEAGTVTVTTEPPSAPAPRKVGSFIEFMDLFTGPEQLAIKAASIQSAELGLWYDRALGRKSVDLETVEMSDGLDALVAANLISAARKAEILGWDFDAESE